ncbi:Hypoxic response protein 1 [Legionella massiliensis]|uniref:Hypoxic response protein 1 n=1 Tax=Legionella massiliensis TaxID=1034943 RepID=A0A078KWF3_9GAMM|nr:CBS domain-containing protein [Legionella massiliensis]CDZ78795.1 Hypoxic response protein 1 [Legionella massiliensis]CEE14533.1 Hypoxic response protein 1 [Legionella massiliensis]
MSSPIYSALPHPRRPMVCVHPMMSVSQCIDLMAKENIGALVVCDDEQLLGMVTERDIVRACLQPNLDLHSTSAKDIDYKDVAILDLFDPVELAMEIITNTKRRHVLVAEEGEVVAILSIGDVLFYLLEDKTRVIEQLENYIHTY